MGLDMHLTKSRYLTDKERASLKIEFPIEPGWSVPKLSRVKEIVEEVAYWRKANAIHAWFVRNVQEGRDDCGIYYVSAEHLKSLLLVVVTVLDNPDRASELLPTMDGFYFGSLMYDEDYFESLEYTREILQALVDEESWDTLYYHTSW